RKVLALRGYIKMAGMDALPPEKRLSMSKKALNLATRDDESRMALGNFARIITADSLKTVLPYLDNPNLRDEAAAAALAVSEQLPPKDSPLVIDAMDKILK